MKEHISRVMCLVVLCILPAISGVSGISQYDRNISDVVLQDPDTLIRSFENGTFPDYSYEMLTEYQDLLYRKLALGLAGRGDYRTAAEILLSIPSHTRSYESSLLLAFMYLRMQEYDAALAHIVSLQVQYPDDLKLDNARAYTLCMAGFPADARRIMEPVMTYAPDYGPFLDTWGTILAAQGQYTKARLACEKARVLLPDDGEVLAHLGMIVYRSGRITDAQDLYQQSISRDPAYGPGQKGYARVLMDLGRYPEAEKAIRAALRLMPGDSELIAWEQETDAILLAWHIRQEQEADHPLLIKRVVPESRS
ncbi:MAG TPA: tetratricopeptide repeat protein [Methanospirillum sp.]|nr:tetratricopeptide repeat protein [Methanospirillum sp.]